MFSTQKAAFDVSSSAALDHSVYTTAEPAIARPAVAVSGSTVHVDAFSGIMKLSILVGGSVALWSLIGVSASHVLSAI